MVRERESGRRKLERRHGQSGGEKSGRQRCQTLLEIVTDQAQSQGWREGKASGRRLLRGKMDRDVKGSHREEPWTRGQREERWTEKSLREEVGKGTRK
jgi:hypothetical protein